MDVENLTCDECGKPKGKIIEAVGIGLIILCKACFFALTDEGEECPHE